MPPITVERPAELHKSECVAAQRPSWTLFRRREASFGKEPLLPK